MYRPHRSQPPQTTVTDPALTPVRAIVDDLARVGELPGQPLPRSTMPRSSPMSASSPTISSPPLVCSCDGSGVVLERLERARDERLVVLDIYTIGTREIAQVPCVCASGQERMHRWRNLPAEADGVYLRRGGLSVVAAQREAVAAAQSFIGQPTGWLVLAGAYGVGKTQIIYATLNHLADLGQHGRYIELPTLLDELRGIVAQGGDHRVVLKRLIDAPLLAIDECDKARESAFTQEVFEALFLARYRQRGTHGTIIGFNADRIDQIPPFVVSRMRDERFRFVEMRGADLRPVARQLAANAAVAGKWDRGKGEHVHAG